MLAFLFPYHNITTTVFRGIALRQLDFAGVICQSQRFFSNQVGAKGKVKEKGKGKRVDRGISRPPLPLVQLYTPLPAGYRHYQHHNDNPLVPESQHTMARVYESDHPDIASLKLPRCSVFDYLFLPKVKGKQTSYYPQPNPDGVAYIDGLTGEKVRRGEVEDQARRLASGLRRLGLEGGDVVCLFGMNSLEWINALFGSQAAGLVVSPASYG